MNSADTLISAIDQLRTMRDDDMPPPLPVSRKKTPPGEAHYEAAVACSRLAAQHDDRSKFLESKGHFSKVPVRGQVMLALDTAMYEFHKQRTIASADELIAALLRYRSEIA